MDIDTIFDVPEFTSTGSRYINQKFRQPKILAFGWYGGKFSHLDFLRPLFPLDANIFCDVFGGSGAVILNVGEYPSKVYNDINPEVVNFFRVLKNPETTETLIREIALTPYGREEFSIACHALHSVPELQTERARLFYIRVLQSIASNVQLTRAYNWDSEKHLVRATGIARTNTLWTGKLYNISKVAQRFQTITIENLHALDVLVKYDTPQTLFYCDPPYIFSTRNSKARRSYAHEMTDKDHIYFSDVLKTLQGRVVLSGYRSDLYDTLYKDWNRVDSEISTCTINRKERQECVWKNF